jgi:ABC-type amino acid transport substrate-binding protein
MHRNDFFRRAIIIFFSTFFAVAALADDAITTLKPGQLTVGVIEICKQYKPHHPCWVYQIMSQFAREHHLELQLKIVRDEGAWLLPAENKVDIAATGISVLSERQVPGMTFSQIYVIVKRGIRIHQADVGRFKTLNDFIGQRIGAVSGTTGAIDLKRRAPRGVEVVIVDTWQEMYALFQQHKVAGVAEGYYILKTSQGDVNENDDDQTMMVDIHDLNPGKTEGLAFAVRDRSKHLLIELNSFLKSWHPPEIHY